MIRKKHKNSEEENKNYIILSRSSLYFIGILLLITTFISGYFFEKVNSAEKITQLNNNPPQQVQAQAQQQAQQPTNPKISLDTIKGLFAKNVVKFGKGDKKLLMVMVSDPSCPYCHVAGGANNEIGAKMGPQFASGTYVAPVPEMKKLIDQGKADFIWLYTNGHGNGELATKAIYCANDQGKFWQAHDLLMSAKGYTLINDEVKNDTSKSQIMANFLTSAVNKNELKSCLDSGKYNSRLAEDSALATSLGINGTPGFYLNTTNFAGAYNWSDMKSTADTALQ